MVGHPITRQEDRPRAIGPTFVESEAVLTICYAPVVPGLPIRRPMQDQGIVALGSECRPLACPPWPWSLRRHRRCHQPGGERGERGRRRWRRAGAERFSRHRSARLYGRRDDGEVQDWPFSARHSVGRHLDSRRQIRVLVPSPHVVNRSTATRVLLFFFPDQIEQGLVRGDEALHILRDGRIGLSRIIRPRQRPRRSCASCSTARRERPR